jgi:hypothetical protein
MFYTIGRTLWTKVQHVARPLPTHRTTQTQISIPQVGFEPTNPVFERAKTVHALDSAATVIGPLACDGKKRMVINLPLYVSPETSCGKFCNVKRKENRTNIADWKTLFSDATQAYIMTLIIIIGPS